MEDSRASGSIPAYKDTVRSEARQKADLGQSLGSL